jgi:hypothetical protein
MILAVALSLPGLGWGVVECWNLDQMGHLKLRPDGLPQHYLKPPLHTYLNHFLVLKPLKQVLGGWFGLPKARRWGLLLWGSRILTLILFAAFVALFYGTLRGTVGETGSLSAALLVATSSGILVFNHFLTADSPLLFWMGASLFFAVRSGMGAHSGNAVLAGLLAGLAAANKYNGLGVCVAIPAALWVAHGWRFVLRPDPWLAGLALPLGFLIGNPGAVVDARRFMDDFFYNYHTTPVYDGTTGGTGYVKFLGCLPELLGWPGTLLVGSGAIATLVLWVMGRLRKSEVVLCAAVLAVFLFNFATIGKFPRMGTRFVLPAVPFLVALAAPACSRMSIPVLAWILIPLLAYNVASSLGMGMRFAGDPRVPAMRWAEAHIPAGAHIESSYAPSWQRVPDKDWVVSTLPAATGRRELFAKILSDKPSVQEGAARFETPIDDKIFTAEGLKSRAPEWVAFSTHVFEWSGDDRAQRFYADLDAGRLPYRKCFESAAVDRWPWTYPVRIDFLVDRMVILQRCDPD